jgi:hypothetical protein
MGIRLKWQTLLLENSLASNLLLLLIHLLCLLVCVNRRPEELAAANDDVVRGCQGNDILQRFKLNGQVALITGGDES